MTDISELVKSEISDFCAGLESPGRPETPEEIQRQLMDRILPLIKDERREWLARGVELAIIKLKGLGDKSYSPYELECLSNYIRAGEVE